MATETKHDFDPWDGTPGDSYDRFQERLLNACSKTDDRGWSFADHLNGIDEGGPAGVALPPAATADGRKALAAFRKRQKESYGVIVRHITSLQITWRIVPGWELGSGAALGFCKSPPS